MMDIREITRPELPRDGAWLQNALQAAIELEFFTIPPYLTAMWSIVDPSDPAVRILRSIIYEEMEHMALACNMLLAVGGHPQINAATAIPSYPNPMPGNVNPQLIIGLQRFSPEVVQCFMEIESPETPLEFPSMLEAMPIGEFSRIGELYSAIEQAFVELDKQLPWNADRQVAGPLANLVITNLRAAQNAIETIRSQGEGSEKRATGADGRIAHYYRFEQYQRLQQLEPHPSAPNGFAWGTALRFPEVFPMAQVPQGGYDLTNVATAAVPHFKAFDRAYTLMLDHLQATWGNAGQAGLYRAIEQMFELQEPARELMQIPLPGSQQTYGPHFRYQPHASDCARSTAHGISR